MVKWLPLTLLVGCDDKDDQDDTDVPTPTVAGADLVITDAHNYAFQGDLTLGVVPVAPKADLTFDWCALTTDLRGRPVGDPAAIDQLLLVEFLLTQEEVVAKIEANDLLQADSLTQWIRLGLTDCTAPSSTFNILGNDFDPDLLDPATGSTWLLSVTNLEDGAIDVLMSKFVVPTAGSTETTVAVTDGCSSLEVEVDLHSAKTVPARAGERGIIDWSLVTTDVHGRAYDDEKGTRLLVGKVAVETLAEVEARFLRLDDEAEAIYYLDVYGTTQADLAEAVDASGALFPGFDTEGIWLVGVECIGPIECLNPAPLILTVVDVAP